MKHNGLRTDQRIATNASLSQPTIPKSCINRRGLEINVTEGKPGDSSSKSADQLRQMKVQ